MSWLKWVRLPRATITRMTFSLLALFILIESLLIATFHLYVVDPAAKEFIQILSEGAPSAGRSLPEPLLARPASDLPGSKPQNYFLAQARHDLQRRGGDLRITPYDPRNGSGVLWVRSSAQPRGWVGFIISRPEFDVDYFVILRMLAVGVIGLAGTVFVIARINRPLARLAAQAESIGYNRESTDFVTFGGPKEVVAVELSMRRMAADLHSFHEEREVLLTGISHELRTPLARLVLALELPDDMILQQKAAMQADLAEMDQSLATFLALIRSDGREQAVTADICSFLDEMAELGVARYGLAITWLRPAEPILIPYRPLMMERLARNLLDNASRYGARTLEIALTLPPGQLQILFRDDGPGLHALSEDEHAASAMRAGQGSGVGLMLCRKIAALHGGSFTAANGPKRGLEACLTLPRPSPMLELG
jgi:two-component system, OmpR family, osmolarity sensor histidine kinase EnvZ